MNFLSLSGFSIFLVFVFMHECRFQQQNINDTFSPSPPSSIFKNPSKVNGPLSINSPTPAPPPPPFAPPPHLQQDHSYTTSHVQDVNSEEIVTSVEPQSEVYDSSTALETCIKSALETYYSDMLTALEKTGIIGEISENSTVLIPTNEAMRDFSDDLGVDFEDIFLFQANIAAIREVMMLHIIVKEYITLENMHQKPHQITTLLDYKLNIDKDQISVDGSITNTTVKVQPGLERCDISFLEISEVLTPTTLV